MGVPVESKRAVSMEQKGEWNDVSVHVLLYVFDCVAVFEYFQLIDSTEYSSMAFIVSHFIYSNS